MPPKRRFRPPPQVLRKNGKMCEPAMLYLIISVLGLIMIIMQNTSSDVYCMGTYDCENISKPIAFIIQVFYIVFWTWLLNTLCKAGYKNISWIIVLFPFLLYAAIVFGLASNGVFRLREGNKTDAKAQPSEPAAAAPVAVAKEDAEEDAPIQCSGHYGDGGDDEVMLHSNFNWYCNSCNCRNLDDALEGGDVARARVNMVNLGSKLDLLEDVVEAGQRTGPLATARRTALLAAHGEVSDAASLVNDPLSEFANSMNT